MTISYIVTPEKLEALFDYLVSNTINVKRDEDFLRLNFEETPREFWMLWKNILLNQPLAERYIQGD